MQFEVFLKEEGDNYYERNKNIKFKKDLLYKEIQKKSKIYNISKLLEVGCGSGERLNLLNKNLNIKCYGLEPSKKAVNSIKKKYKKIIVKRGTANNFIFKNINFNAVVFGFCLYLVDIDHFTKVYEETDKVTKKGSLIFIKDFYSNEFRSFLYKHNKKIIVNKYDFSRIFSWSPKFQVISKKFFDHDNPTNKSLIKKNNLVCISIIKKIRD